MPALPYAADAFGKQISPETFYFHHGKHHGAGNHCEHFKVSYE